MAYRAQYPEPVKELVKRKYPLCRSRADREALTRECDELMRQLNPEIDHPPMTLQKLYNLASRLEATRGHANTHVDWVGEGEAETYDAKNDPSRLKMRDNPDTLVWSESDDRYLRDHWGKTWIEQIAYFLQRTEISVAYRARHLGLRNIPKYWDIEKVAPWLGMTVEEVTKILPYKGLETFDCCDQHGNVQITLVSTMSLSRVFARGHFYNTLIDVRNADRFFIMDIMESVEACQLGESTWEATDWVSHAHTCLNPFSENCFGWFYDGYDTDMAGWDLDVHDLHPRTGIGTDRWVPTRRRSGASRRIVENVIPIRQAA